MSLRSSGLRLLRPGAENLAIPRQPVRHEAVTHVLGTWCYLCTGGQGFHGEQVARMSAAICGDQSPGCCFAHPGYACFDLEQKPCNPSTTPSTRGCHPCLRYVVLPICTGGQGFHGERGGTRTLDPMIKSYTIESYCNLFKRIEL
jgi:hypothetical protein